MLPPKTTCTWLLVYGLLTPYLLLVSCQQPEPTPPLSAEETQLVQALDQVILPLKDADPTRKFTELRPLDSLFRPVQLVGLGEATHGTHEFFQMKARLFRYLVEQHGFRTLAFEASFGSCVGINRYIHGQSTSLKTATEAAKSIGYWAWRTTEVRDLIEWMRQYNQGKPAGEKLSFYGFDCQIRADNYPLINEFVARVDPDTYAKLPQLYQTLTRTGEIYELFVANQINWVAAGGRLDYELAKQAARVLVQQQDLTGNGACNRDRYMAENSQWLLSTLGAGKVSLWAHDHHVGNWSAYCGQPMMGAYLKQRFGQRYLAVGQSLSNGSFHAFDQGVISAFSVRSQQVPTSFNYLLGRTRQANFALRLNQPLLASSLLKWLTQERSLFEPGAFFDPTKQPDFYYAQSALVGRYDVLIHIRDTAPSEFLP
ncbi:MAG: erythromycin esterase family protein [Cytophagaceae bacterium]|nr:MAG: erythromycin esterase family protein [Cytophagaceae bacterium]